MTRCLTLLFVVGAGLSSPPIHARHAVSDGKRTIVLEGRAASFLASPPIHAHHAVSDVYDDERTIVVEGLVMSFLFGDPHSMVQVRVRDGDGRLHTWAVEWRAASRLQRLGWTADALSVGDRVRVCGNPGRDPGAYRLHLLNVTRIAPGARPAADDPLCEPASPAMRSAGSNARLGSSRAPGR